MGTESGSRIEQLSDRVTVLEDRLERLEAAAARGAMIGGLERAGGMPVSATVSATEPAHGSTAELLPIYGRTLLIFAGAFLIRAFTESGALPQGVGTAIGIVYALAWLFLADRAAPKSRTSATFLGLAGVGIAFPLVWEATTKFGFLSPQTSAVAFAAVAGVAILLVARRDLHGLAWVVGLGGAGVAAALVLGTKSWGPFVFELEVIAAAFLVLGRPRGWDALRWLLTAAATTTVVLMTVTLIVSPADRVATIYSPSTLLFLQLAWVLLFFGTLAYQTVVDRQEVGIADTFFSVTTLVSGFGGALMVTSAGLVSETPLALTSLVLAVGGYAASFAFADRALSRANFLFYSSFALTVTLVASGSLLDGAPLALLLAFLALATGALGAYKARATLTVHSAVYLVASLAVSGGLGAIYAASAGDAPPALGWLTVATLAVIAVALIDAWMPVATHGRTWGSFSRTPKAVVELLLLACAGAALVSLFRSFVVGPDGVDIGALSALRTGALAAAAVAAAWLGRQSRWPEAGWLVYPILLLGGVKLLLVDLPQGRPATLVLSFLFYGAALILAPRISRSSGRAGKSDAEVA